MSNLDFEQINHMRIRVNDLDSGGSIEAQTVEANLLYAVLEKLEEIRMQGVDIENAIERK